MAGKRKTIFVWLVALVIPNVLFVLLPPSPEPFVAFGGTGAREVVATIISMKMLVVVTPAGVAFGWGMERMWRHLLLYILLIGCFAAIGVVVTLPETPWGYILGAFTILVYGCLGGALIGRTLRDRTRA